jgi:hypothetical protein
MCVLYRCSDVLRKGKTLPGYSFIVLRGKKRRKSQKTKKLADKSEKILA